MAVLPHEGSYNILYGSYGVPVGSSNQPGYVARPDKKGAYPVVVVVPDINGLTSSEKDLCRFLARHGFATVAIDLYRGAAPRRGASLDEAIAAYGALGDRRALTDIDETIAFCLGDDIDWSRKGPVGLVGLDTGGRFALLYAAERPNVGGLVVVQAPLAGDDDRLLTVENALERLTMPVLGLYGQDDSLIPAEGVDVAADLNPSGEWILYDGAGHDFLNLEADGYHAGAAADASVRMVRFLTSSLPAPELLDY
ncbi:MAG: dienelactone hydrolase family protein [Acidimicrobiia bacterium]|nr:dienelactone hydrolase family protein [Acidimicrobiia bacterium]